MGFSGSTHVSNSGTVHHIAYGSAGEDRFSPSPAVVSPDQVVVQSPYSGFNRVGLGKAEAGVLYTVPSPNLVSNDKPTGIAYRGKFLRSLFCNTFMYFALQQSLVITASCARLLLGVS